MMNQKLKELIIKKAKEGEFLNEKEAKAKSDILDEIDDIMEEKMKGHLSKITIAAPNKEGLKAGLEKAEEIMEEPEESENSQKIKELKARLEAYDNQ